MTLPSMIGREASTEERAEARTLNRRGIACLARGDVAAALSDFKQAASLAPDYAEAWNNSGLVLRMLGRAEEAVADFDRAVVIRPEYSEALTNRGHARQWTGHPNLALADFDRALACTAGRFAASILHSRGGLKQDVGDVAGALADYDRALEIDPEHSSTYFNRGTARKDAGDLDGALADFEQALARLPHNAGAVLHKRGGVRALQNDFAGAIDDYDRAVALEPENLFYYLSRGNARYHRREMRALLDYRMAFRIDREGAAREILRMIVEDVRRDADYVLDNCNKHLRISDRDVLARVRRGLTLVLLGREEEAVPDFRQANEQVPDMKDCLVRVIHLALETRIDQAFVSADFSRVGPDAEASVEQVV